MNRREIIKGGAVALTGGVAIAAPSPTAATLSSLPDGAADLINITWSETPHTTIQTFGLCGKDGQVLSYGNLAADKAAELFWQHTKHLMTAAIKEAARS